MGERCARVLPSFSVLTIIGYMFVYAVVIEIKCTKCEVLQPLEYVRVAPSCWKTKLVHQVLVLT